MDLNRVDQLENEARLNELLADPSKRRDPELALRASIALEFIDALTGNRKQRRAAISRARRRRK